MRRCWGFRAGWDRRLGRRATALEPVAHRVDQRSRRARAIEQRLRVGQNKRTVPRAGDDERQLEGRARIARRHRAGDAFEIEVARRDGCRADERDPQRRRVEPRLLDAGGALDDSELGRKLVVWCFAAAEVAAHCKRAALEPLEQLLEIEAYDRSLPARKARGPVEALGQLVNAAAGTIEIDGERAFAFELAQTHEVAETLLQVDVGELDLRLDRRAGVGLGEAEGAIGTAA